MKASLFFLLQDVPNIEKKMQEAPNSAYEIGVAIGTYLPFLVLALIAYLLYFNSRKRKGQ